MKTANAWIMALSVLLAATTLSAAAKPAPKPAATLNRATYDIKGWADTVGGKGGRIIRVTNLNESGPGSFREAVETEGPRIVVFEVGGVIDLFGRDIDIRHPFITIAGQTAPSPGITLIRGETHLAKTHDVIVQHLMFRPGDNGAAKMSGWAPDAFSANASYNIIVDHCSMSWGVDENMSASGPRFNGKDIAEWRQNTSHNITYSNNLVFEGLADSGHPKGEHSKGGLFHDNATGILLYGNLYASNEERSGLFKGGVHAAQVNNMIYNPGAKAVHYNLIAHEWGLQPYETGVITLIGNVYRQGPDTDPGVPLFSLGGAGDVSLYLKDNIAVDPNGLPVAQTGYYTAGPARILNAKTPYLPADIRMVSARSLENQIYGTVGARPWDRDDVDFKILSDIAEGRGEIIDSQTQNYIGYPKYKATSAPFIEADWNLDDMSPKAGWDSLFAKTYPKH